MNLKFVYQVVPLVLCLVTAEAKWGDVRETYSVPIAAVFGPETVHLEEDFQSALESKTVVHFQGRSIILQNDDSYSALMKVIESTSENKGVMAVLDLRKMHGYCDVLCTLCLKYKIPYLTHHWRSPGNMNSTLMYQISPEEISKAYASLIIKELRWDKFAMIYEDGDGLIRMQEILKAWPTKGHPVILRKLDPEGNNRGVFKELGILGVMRFVIDCHADNILPYVEQIVDVTQKTDYQSYIFTSLDTHTLNFSIVPGFFANISTLHLTNSQDPYWSSFNVGGNVKYFDGSKVRVETAVLVDMVTHLKSVIERIYNIDDNDECKAMLKKPLPSLALIGGGDYSERAWLGGECLMERLKNSTINGRTGLVKFERNGRRIDYQLNYARYTGSDGFVDESLFNSSIDGFVNVSVQANTSPSKGNVLQNDKQFQVASLLVPPYFGKFNNSRGEVFYEGFAVDLIDRIMAYLNTTHKFNYTFTFYEVDTTGSAYANLAQDLIHHKADMVVCDFTITLDRISKLDFSVPFMSTGISILFQKPQYVPPDKFSFMVPFTLEVWLLLATTLLVVSFVLVICARICQGDWVNPHPCNRNPESLQNIWDLYNCAWLVMASIMTQGCDILPRALGSRWVASMWYFFCLIVTSSFTANLSSIMINARNKKTIESAKDLAEQNSVSYGTVLGGSTYKFFENTNDTVYSKLWNNMISFRPSPFLKSNDAGKDRVLRGKHHFAFFMESTSLEYYISRNCDLQRVGGLLDSKAYGIGMPKNSPYKKFIDEAILNLEEDIRNLKDKWWTMMHNENQCVEDEKPSDSLQMSKTSGIFIVLASGTLLGVVAAMVDFLFHVRKIMVKEKVDFKTAFLSEWRSSLNPRSLSKPVQPSRSAAPSRSPSRARSTSRAVSVLRAATSFINFDDAY